jgi:hypothetical protein
MVLWSLLLPFCLIDDVGKIYSATLLMNKKAEGVILICESVKGPSFALE